MLFCKVEVLALIRVHNFFAELADLMCPCVIYTVDVIYH